jgi:diadenosine tetraphosphate (Ap4A) HIT family hydrolase
MATTDFQLHERLAADTLEVTRWPLSRVLLMKDRNFPWLILVPARPGLRNLHDLAAADQITAMEEVSRASRVLETLYRPDKINVGAIGNMVPQLHIHVVARFQSDAAWPKPPWGNVPPLPYADAALASTVTRLREALV